MVRMYLATVFFTEQKWFEENCTMQEYGNIPIWEPCNYASNIAYYHTTTEICYRQEWNMPSDAGNFFTFLNRLYEFQ